MGSAPSRKTNRMTVALRFRCPHDTVLRHRPETLAFIDSELRDLTFNPPESEAVVSVDKSQYLLLRKFGTVYLDGRSILSHIRIDQKFEAGVAGWGAEVYSDSDAYVTVENRPLRIKDICETCGFIDFEQVGDIQIASKNDPTVWDFIRTTEGGFLLVSERVCDAIKEFEIPIRKVIDSPFRQIVFRDSYRLLPNQPPISAEHCCKACGRYGTVRRNRVLEGCEPPKDCPELTILDDGLPVSLSKTNLDCSREHFAISEDWIGTKARHNLDETRKLMEQRVQTFGPLDSTPLYFATKNLILKILAINACGFAFRPIIEM